MKKFETGVGAPRLKDPTNPTQTRPEPDSKHSRVQIYGPMYGPGPGTSRETRAGQDFFTFWRF